MAAGPTQSPARPPRGGLQVLRPPLLGTFGPSSWDAGSVRKAQPPRSAGLGWGEMWHKMEACRQDPLGASRRAAVQPWRAWLPPSRSSVHGPGKAGEEAGFLHLQPAGGGLFSVTLGAAGTARLPAAPPPPHPPARGEREETLRPTRVTWHKEPLGGAVTPSNWGLRTRRRLGALQAGPSRQPLPPRQEAQRVWGAGC